MRSLDPTAPAGWLLTAAIFFSPWAFGCRSYGAALTLAAVLLAAGLLWGASLLWERRLPRVPPLCVGVVLFLAAFAGVALLNPRSAFDGAHRSFAPNSAYLPFLPGTVDAATSWTFTVGMLGCLCVIPVATDLGRDPRWRRRWLASVAWTGLLVGVAGLALATGAFPRLYRALEHRPWAQDEIFGPFDYHGNSGSFFNLALPACAWMAAMANAPARRLGWRCAAGVTYVALFANNSRSALAIGTCLAPACGWIMLRNDHRSLEPAPTRRVGLGTAVPLALLCLGLVLVGHFLKPWARLRRLPSEMRETEYPRYMQSRAAWEMTQERPVYGAGVGTYKVLVQTSSIRRFYFAPAFRPGDTFTRLSHAQEDYLQTLAEWGWVGFGAWAVLVGGAFACVGRFLWQTRFAARTGLAVGTALASLYLHALDDCPLQIPVLQLYAAVFLGLAWGSPACPPCPPASLTCAASDTT